MKALVVLISLFFLGGVAGTVGLLFSDAPKVAIANILPLCFLGWVAIDTIRRARAEQRRKGVKAH